MTQIPQRAPSQGLYARLLAAERIGGELAYELQICAPESMLRKALGSRGSTTRTIIGDWIQSQSDLSGNIGHPLEEDIKEELRRRLKAQLIAKFPDFCNY